MNDVRLLLTAAADRDTSNNSGDGGDSNAVESGFGADGEYVRSVGAHFRIGLGARYEVGRGTDNLGKVETDHFFALPVLLGARGRLGSGRAELLLGAGPAWIRSDFLATSTLSGWGAGAELAATYSHPIGTTWAVSVGIALRAAITDKTGSRDQLDSLTHVSLPLRVGLQWSR